MGKYDHKFWTILILSIIGLVAICCFVIKPVIFDIAEKYIKINDQQKELNALEEEKNTDIELKNNQEKITGMFNKVGTFMPVKLDSGDFVVQIENIAKNTNQNQTDIIIKNSSDSQTASSDDSAAKSSKAGAGKSEPKEANFVITQKGTFPDLINFMQNMEKMSRIYTLQGLSLTMGTDNTLETKISGTIYYKPDVTAKISSYILSPAEEKKINDLEHFGEIITPENTASSGRTDPFVNP